MSVLRVIVCAYNCVEFLDRCLKSLSKQTYAAFTVTVVDDASTDFRQRPLIEHYCARHGWQSLFSEEHRGGLYSMIQGIHACCPDDDDVICIVDGDDWLAHERALEVVARLYLEPEVWVSYGSFETFPEGQIDRTLLDQEVPKRVLQEGRQRDYPWVFSHLQTFKYFLWKRVDDRDLRDGDGQYFRVCGDRARFYPVLEMAGIHSRRLSEVVYVYNMANPLNDFRIHAEQQRRACAQILAKPRYHPLGEEDV